MTVLFAFAFALIVWWLATGAVAFAVRVAESRRRIVSFVFGVIGAIGISGLIWSSSQVSVWAAYTGFASALAVWAFHEALFLMGIVTGSRPYPCPEHARGGVRFRAAFRAIDHHEIALFATVFVLCVWLGGGANPVGPMLLAVMWVMRLSTKLIVFHGAPNAISDLMPPRVRYLHTYFRTDRVTPFFPIALAFSACLFIVLVDAVFQARTEYGLVGHSLVGTFVLLAVAEHIFLIVPWRDASLWDWAIHKDKDVADDRVSSADSDERNHLPIVDISPSIQRTRRSVLMERGL
ncbi:MAG: putative photosynthetic complex assembly protein PuhE [Pseudomonadota bacterium]